MVELARPSDEWMALERMPRPPVNRPTVSLATDMPPRRKASLNPPVRLLPRTGDTGGGEGAICIVAPLVKGCDDVANTILISLTIWWLLFR